MPFVMRFTNGEDSIVIIVFFLLSTPYSFKLNIVKSCIKYIQYIMWVFFFLFVRTDRIVTICNPSALDSANEKLNILLHCICEHPNAHMTSELGKQTSALSQKGKPRGSIC